jgi:predicted PhzF superfamily epimerase YddE/YHI9
VTSDLAFDVVRVFTTRDGRLGNELAVIESSTATAGREQVLAAELGFSETVFVDDVAGGVATLRIFTPVAELPFAGHPTVGTAWWLANRGAPVTVLRVPAGDVRVQTRDEVTWVRALGTWPGAFEWHVLGSVSEVDALDPAEFIAGIHYAYAWIDEPAGHLRSRMFSPAYGIVEDQATGAAALRLSWELGRDLTITQGLGSQLFTHRLDGDLVEVGGRTRFDRTIRV